MKNLLNLFILMVFAASLSVAKVKEVATLTISNDNYDNYFWNEKGYVLLENNVNSPGFSVTIYKNGKKAGGGIVPVPSDILSNNCKHVFNALDFKRIVVKYSNGSNVYFYLYKVNDTFEEIGKFETLSGNVPGRCCPNFYSFNNGKRFGFKQRYIATVPHVVKYMTFDKNFKVKSELEIETPAYRCTDFSPHGKYIFAVDKENGAEYTLNIYKTGKEISKIANDLNSIQEYWDFNGKKDKIVYHMKTNNFVEIAKIGSYIPLCSFINDNLVSEYQVDDFGNVAVLYTNRTISIINKNGTIGPFQINDLISSENLWISDFNKNKIIIGFRNRIGNNTNDFYYYGYKISKNGLKKYKNEVSFKNVLDIDRITFSKYIVIYIENAAQERFVAVYKKNLKLHCKQNYSGNQLPDCTENGMLDLNVDGTNSLFKIYKW